MHSTAHIHKHTQHTHTNIHRTHTYTAHTHKMHRTAHTGLGRARDVQVFVRSCWSLQAFLSLGRHRWQLCAWFSMHTHNNKVYTCTFDTC